MMMMMMPFHAVEVTMMCVQVADIMMTIHILILLIPTFDVERRYKVKWIIVMICIGY